MNEHTPMVEYRAPAVDKAIAILEAINSFQYGLSIQELAETCDIPKSTVYRVLNSLELANIVRRVPRTGAYVLGSRLVTYAANVASGFDRERLVALARPHLERLTNVTREASKLSVLDGTMTLCVDVVPGTRGYSVSPAVGRRWPLYAGAGGKVLLAHMEPRAKADFLSRGLETYTRHTITVVAELEAELATIVRQGWAEDRGEHLISIGALAAPIFDSTNALVAAVSTVYFADLHTKYRQSLVENVRSAAEEITREISRDAGLASAERG